MLHAQLTSIILKACFEVANELGIGFLENVYKNALVLALEETGLKIEVEKSFEVIFRGKRVGFYIADLVVQEYVIVETKCSRALLPQHQAQLINYLAISKCPIGLLINFGNKKLEIKRVQHPDDEELIHKIRLAPEGDTNKEFPPLKKEIVGY
jgi:GxxExxY protein